MQTTKSDSTTKRITKKNGILCWHYLASSGMTANGENLLVVAGQTLKVKPPVELCEHGYHASISALDALQYAPGMILQRCVLWGDVEHGQDKLVASNRTCLWVVDATNAILEFACWCAEQAFDEIRKIGLEPDQRSVHAVNVVRLWIEHKATKEELNAADAAAYAAARAARAAADAATAAAADAADAAAYAAAYAARAARAAARAARAAADAADAATYAARAAADAAARAARAAADAAAAAEIKVKQNAKLEELLLALEPIKIVAE